MGVWTRIEGIVLGQRGMMMPWAPVCLGAGIGVFFMVRGEPPVALLWVSGMLALLLGWGALRSGAALAPGLVALALVVAGFALAGARAHWVAGPVLDFRYYGAIEGRVVGLDRSASGALRMTLDRVRLARVHDPPRRVRISMQAPQINRPMPGMRVMTTGHLEPPRDPVEPGGFDFRRHAWFLGLGAVGYSRTPVLISEPPQGEQWIFALRMKVSRAVQNVLPGDVGAFAAAITTGDRSELTETTRDALRRTNLSHLLAISGLHMGLLAGFVFGTVRLALVLLPGAALMWPVHKCAALAALGAAAIYLALSGGNVATERAFVMVAVALVAVLFDRRAMSMRAVALAALVVLILRPEALLGPGFQMSFAATTALVAVFAALRDERVPDLPGWARPLVMVALSSAVAGLATAPVAAAHFNRFSQFGLLANLLTVPLMGLLVIPAAVVAACLAPFGMEGVGLWIMGQGLRWVLAVAHEISGWEGVVRAVPTPAGAVLPLIAAGGLILALWRGRGRLIGVAPLAFGALLWAGTERPAVLVAEDGALVGVQTAEGRALSRETGAGFVAEVWLENDGELVFQADAARRWLARTRFLAQAPLPGGGTLWHVRGKRAISEFESCAPGDLAVFDKPPIRDLPCDVLDPQTLRISGALAIDAGGKRRSVHDMSGERLWSAARP